MHTYKTTTIDTRLEMHNSYTHSTRNSNTKHPQHNNPSTQNITHTLNSQQKDENIFILQIHINGIRNKTEDLKYLAHNTQPDIITIQETKLTQKYPTTPRYAQTGNTTKKGNCCLSTSMALNSGESPHFPLVVIYSHIHSSS